jgi:hypothetical protein
MRISLSRVLTVIAVSLSVAVPCLFASGTALAQVVQTGTFSITSDPGDPIAGGGSFSYDTTAGDAMRVTGSSDNRSVEVDLDAANGNTWFLFLAAPAGQTLVPGMYTADGTGDSNAPVINLAGLGTGCNQTPGSFTINTIEWAPRGYVQALDATFEQHCEAFEAATRGHVHITNPPPPPDLALGVTVAMNGTANIWNGNATLRGTVSCNKGAMVGVSGTLTQTNKGFIARGAYFTEVSCSPGDPIAWTATVEPASTVAFQKGDAQATTQAGAWDTDYGIFATASDTTVVKLAKTS